jgi:hypothetical protein
MALLQRREIMPPAPFIQALRRGLSVLCPLLLLVLACSGCGCRHKANPIEPPPPPQGQWTIELRAPLVMYRDHVGGHVINDTIIVRVFNDSGQLTGGALIYSQASVSHDSVTGVATSYGDSIAHPSGCYPAIIYWGTGGVDGQESVHSWVVVDGDTVAETSASFKVMDPL